MFYKVYLIKQLRQIEICSIAKLNIYEKKVQQY